MTLRASRIAVASALFGVLVAACTGNGSDDPPTRGGPSDDGRLSSGAMYTPPPIESVTEPPDDWFTGACTLPVEIAERTMRGYHPDRSPELMLVPHGSNFIGDPESTSHSGPWDYVQRVPLMLYGPGFIEPQGETALEREVTLADLTPTIADLIGFDWPDDGPVRVITEALVPEEDRAGRPKVVVVVVWDGGGWNVLDTWPGTTPNLDRLGAEGTSITNAIVGSSPSVTPSIHTTIGTGVFPQEHGITGIHLRSEGRVSASFPASTGRLIQTPTLADLYDPTTGNVAKIAMVGFRSWHLGMIGKGTLHPGGDNDIGALVNLSEELITNGAVYSLPPQLNHVPGLEADTRTIDQSDGKRDGKWMGHDILSDPRYRRDTPVWALYQTRILKELIASEGFGADDVPDLLYTNYKQIDEAGHTWNMLSEEMPEEIKYADAALGDLTRYLDKQVGRNSWVVALTADHGQTPDPDISRGWPIAVVPFGEDLGAEFGVPAKSLVEKTSPVGIFLNEDTMATEGISHDAIADFAARYRLGDNLVDGARLPELYAGREDDLLFAAAFPGPEMARVWSCVRERS